MLVLAHLRARDDNPYNARHNILQRYYSFIGDIYYEQFQTMDKSRRAESLAHVCTGTRRLYRLCRSAQRS